MDNFMRKQKRRKLIKADNERRRIENAKRKDQQIARDVGEFQMLFDVVVPALAAGVSAFMESLFYHAQHQKEVLRLLQGGEVDEPLDPDLKSDQVQ